MGSKRAEAGDVKEVKDGNEVKEKRAQASGVYVGTAFSGGQVQKPNLPQRTPRARKSKEDRPLQDRQECRCPWRTASRMRGQADGRPYRKKSWLEAEDDTADHVRAVQVMVDIGVVAAEKRVAIGSD